MLNLSRHAEGTFCFGLTNKEEMVQGGVQSRWMRKKCRHTFLGDSGAVMSMSCKFGGQSGQRKECGS